MQSFIPYEKLSKKGRRDRNALRRTTWGVLNPVTRKPETPKAYNRKKARKWSDDSMTVPFAMHVASKVSVLPPAFSLPALPLRLMGHMLRTRNFLLPCRGNCEHKKRTYLTRITSLFWIFDNLPNAGFPCKLIRETISECAMTSNEVFFFDSMPNALPLVM